MASNWGQQTVLATYGASKDQQSAAVTFNIFSADEKLNPQSPEICPKKEKRRSRVQYSWSILCTSQGEVFPE